MLGIMTKLIHLEPPKIYNHGNTAKITDQLSKTELSFSTDNVFLSKLSFFPFIFTKKYLVKIVAELLVSYRTENNGICHFSQTQKITELADFQHGICLSNADFRRLYSLSSI